MAATHAPAWLWIVSPFANVFAGLLAGLARLGPARWRRDPVADLTAALRAKAGELYEQRESNRRLRAECDAIRRDRLAAVRERDEARRRLAVLERERERLRFECEALRGESGPQREVPAG